MIRLFIFLLTGFAALASAQNPPAARSLRLLYVQAPADAPASVFLVAGKRIKEIDLPELSISSKRLGLPPGMVRVYAASKAPTKAEPLPGDAPFVDIPEGMIDPLVVLLPNGATGPLAFRMVALEFSHGHAPESAVLWLNLSSYTLSSTLGTAQAIIAPRQTVIQLPAGKTGEVYHVSVDIKPEHGETESVPLMKSCWVKDPGQRHLLVIIPDPDRKVPRVVDVPERMEPEVEPVKGGKGGAKKASATKNAGK